MWIRWLWLTLAVIALLLPGCLSGRSAAPAQQELELWIVDFNQDTRELLDKNLIPTFEQAHPGVKINTQYIPWSHLDEKLTISFAGGVAPDVFQVGAEYVGGLAYRGMAQPLDDYIGKWVAKDDFFPAAWNTCVYQDRTYGIPYLCAPQALIYRKDLLKQAGFDRPPNTWEELAETAQAMTLRKGAIIDMAGMNLRVSWQVFVEFLWENGGDILTPDGKKSALDSQEAIEALQFYVDLFNTYKVCPTAGMPRAGGGVPVYASKKAAMEINNQFGIYNLKKYAPELLPLTGVAPTTQRKRRIAAVYTDWLAMSPQSKHKNQAWELMMFLMEPEHLAAYNATLYFIPPRRSAVRASKFMQENPQLQEFVTLMDRYGRSLPAIPEWFEIRTGLQSAISAAIYQTKTPKQALNDYTRELNELLAERLEYGDGK